MIARSKPELQRALICVLCVSACVVLLAQNEAPRPALEIRIKPLDVVAGLPDSFEISVMNTGDSNIVYPEPAKACQGNSGSIYLEQRYIGEGNKNASSVNCAADSYSQPAILDRIKHWTVLQPGKSYTVVEKRGELFPEQNDPGVYDLWAVYIPPTLAESDQRMLTNSGYVFPQQLIVSEHLKFAKKP
jgi:hypothetical protein